jgi:hypothetical protein
MTETDAPEMRESDKECDKEQSVTIEEQNWEAQWYDYGALPDTVPEINVHLAQFLVAQASVDEIFSSVLWQEGGDTQLHRGC